MPTLEVKPGITLSYLDSGPPSNANTNTNADTGTEPYTTLFMLHGGSFHTPIFKRVISLSTQPRFNIRFVAITRRDYPGSTPLTDEDVQAFVGTDGSTERRLGAFVQRVEEILLFVREFVMRGWVLPVRRVASGGEKGEGDERGGGGFSLAGSSIGNLQGLAVLAFGNLFPGIVEELEPYFRSYILHEGTMLFPPPLDTYHPLTDESIPKPNRTPFFCNWISSYFDHPTQGLTAGDPAFLNQTTPSPSPTHRPTISQFTREEYEEIVDHGPLIRADTFYFRLDQRVNEGILERVFINERRVKVGVDGGSEGSELPVAWPNVPVRSLYGDKTSWTTIFTQRKLERWVQELHAESGKNQSERWVRKYEPNCVPGANHFLYWEDPEKFLEMVKHLMV